MDLCVSRLSGQREDDVVTDVSEISWLESTHPRMPFTCRFRRALLTVMNKVLVVAVGEWTQTYGVLGGAAKVKAIQVTSDLKHVALEQ